MTRRSLGQDGLLASALLAVALLGAPLALRWARPLYLNLGPNDETYVVNFRSDWEPEGRTRFHWTGIHSRVELPLRLRGDGHRLRLRVRRHFVEPAHVTLRAEGQAFARFDVRAEEGTAWRVLDFPLPALSGRDAFRLEIEAPSDNPRPLGIALDWLEIERSGSARVELLEETRLRLLLAVLAAFVALRLAGLGRTWSGGVAGAVAACAAWGLAHDALAVERILGQGTGAFVVTGLLTAAALRLECVRRGLRASWGRATGVLGAVVVLGLAVRLVILLHPQFYYLDVRIHAVFARELAKTGLLAFLRDFTANQYRFSLGLQFEHGHWYAFPYPPAFYFLCWPFVRALHFRPEIAVALVAAVANAVEALVVFAIGRRLGSRPALALLAAGAVPLLPIFITRLSLAYFPALVGHAVDALVVLYLLSRLPRLGEWRVVLALAGLIAAALLTYTQSLLNWGLLLPVFLLVWLAFDRSSQVRRRQIGLASAGLLGALLSLAFYGRYVPVFLDMQRGVPMAEEQVLADKQARVAAQSATVADEEPDDPFAGPGVNPWRGTKKALWRLYVFYGVFAVAIVAGLGLAWRGAPGPDERRFVATWALLYLLLNLASGGLPGPNLVRYNKDLEIVAPLFCVALAHVALWLWDRSRPLALAFGAAFQAFAAHRAVLALTDKFFAIR